MPSKPDRDEALANKRDDLVERISSTKDLNRVGDTQRPEKSARDRVDAARSRLDSERPQGTE